MASQKHASSTETKSATPVTAGAVVIATSSPVGEVVNAAAISAVQAQKQLNAQGVTFSSSATDLIAQITATGNRAAIGVIENIKTYLTEMKPGRQMSSQTGGQHQVMLFRALQTAVNLVDTDFQLLFATILKIADEHKEGAFSSEYLFRFTDTVKLSANDRQAFLRIINLIVLTAPISGRRTAVGHVDMTRTLEFGFTEDGKRRLLTFFNK